MTPTIETLAALPAFQPGDRVLVECIAGEPLGDDRVIIKFGDGLMSYRTIVAASSVHPLPTREAQLRAAAEVCMTLPPVMQLGDGDGGLYTRLLAGTLNRLADTVESTSAPKPPPTLREVAEHVVRMKYFVNNPSAWRSYDDGKSEQIGEIVSMAEAALAREGAAK